MIFALEGVDCSGKTTLFNEAKVLPINAFFVDMPSPSVELLEHIREVDARANVLWTALYDKRVHIIVDRFFAISSQVYRPCSLDIERWKDCVFFAYVRPSIEIVLTRLRVRGDRHVNEKRVLDLMTLYDREFAKWPNRGLVTSARALKEIVNGWGIR